MSITTKTGDNGDTSLLYGGRVSKDDLRIETNGILDELNSFLGLSKSLLKGRQQKGIIDRIQRDISTLISEIAAGTKSVHRLRRRIKKDDIRMLECLIKKLEKKRGLKRRSFAIPGKNTLSATLDIARTIARTAERRIVTLKNKKVVKSEIIPVYLNRLSDLLYLLARSYEKR